MFKFSVLWHSEKTVQLCLQATLLHKTRAFFFSLIICTSHLKLRHDFASQHSRWAGRTSPPSNFFGRQRIYFILSVLYTTEGIVSEQSNYFNLIIRHTWLAKGRCAKWSLVFIWIPTC